MSTLEFGLDTFLPVTVDEAGLPISGDQVIRNTVEEAVLAEAVGIDSFNIGEHYLTEFMDSAGHVILAAIASRTARIRLGSAVTVLSDHRRGRTSRRHHCARGTASPSNPTAHRSPPPTAQTNSEGESHAGDSGDAAGVVF